LTVVSSEARFTVTHYSSRYTDARSAIVAR